MCSWEEGFCAVALDFFRGGRMEEENVRWIEKGTGSGLGNDAWNS